MTKTKKITPFMKQCFVTSAVCLNVVGHGCCLGYPGVLFPQLQEPGSIIVLTKEADSWIASILAMALLVGNFCTAPIMSRFGRRTAHIAVTLPVMAAWITMILATTVEALFIGRILQGLSFGMLLPLRSPLIGEYTSPKNRGAFLTTISLAQGAGIFFVHLIGSLLSWQRTALVCLFFSFTSLVLILYSPESPSWLAAMGRYDESRKIFRWLRGDEEDEELEEMIQARILLKKLETRKSKVKQSLFVQIRETIGKKEFYKPIVIMFHFYFLMHVSGGTTMASYATMVIGALMGPSANANLWMIALDTQRLISNTLAVFVINKVKRRTMLFSTGALCVISHLAIAGYVYAKLTGHFNYESIWLPAFLINCQIFSVSLGMIPMPNIIAGEVFPLEYSSIGGSISMIGMSGFMVLVLKTFTGLITRIGLHGTYLIYAGILAYNLVVFWVLLPETKGKTLQQIEDEFRGRPLTFEELASRQSLHHDPVEVYKRKLSQHSVPSMI